MESMSPISQFAIPVRVYYEDTDAAGVVYYANYLRFLERCRTEWIRHLGYGQEVLAREQDLAFVVKAVNLEYLRPARLDDALHVTLSVEKLGRAQIIFRQTILRQDVVLLTGTVQVVSVQASKMKPTSIPEPLRSQLETLL